MPTTKQSDGEQCGSSVSRRGVEDKNRQVILDAHNALRSIVASGQESRGRPGPQPQASNMQIMVGWHTHTHGSHVVSNNLPLIIRVCALLLWFALHAWLETCRQSLSYSLSPPHLSFLSCATKCVLAVLSECNQTWDEELATVAQRLAEQCLFEHDCNECRKVGKFSVRIIFPCFKRYFRSEY